MQSKERRSNTIYCDDRQMNLQCIFCKKDKTYESCTEFKEKPAKYIGAYFTPCPKWESKDKKKYTEQPTPCIK